MSKRIIEKITKEPTVCFNSELVFLPTDLQKKIDDHWKELLRSGRKYFNGEVFSLTKLEQKNSKISITVQKTNFAHFLYTRNTERKLGKYRLRTVFASCLIITSDNKIILGKMGEHTSLAGRYQLVGGGLDDNDLKGDIFDMKHSAVKELGEELGINASNKDIVRKFKVAYLKTGGSENVAIIYRVELNKTAEEMLKYYKKFEKDLKKKGETPEFSEVIALPQNRKDVEKFINDNKDTIANYLPAVLQQAVKDN